MNIFNKIALPILLLLLFSLSPAHAGGITGTLYIAPELRNRVSPSDTVYIMAQAQFGPTQPLALKRYRASDLPIDFEISDSDARMRGLSISDYPEFRIIGWVTKSGLAYLEQGDFQGIVNNVREGDNFVRVIINQIAR